MILIQVNLLVTPGGKEVHNQDHEPDREHERHDRCVEQRVLGSVEPSLGQWLSCRSGNSEAPLCPTNV